MSGPKADGRALRWLCFRLWLRSFVLRLRSFLFPPIFGEGIKAELTVFIGVARLEIVLKDETAKTPGIYIPATGWANRATAKVTVRYSRQV